MIFVAYIGPGLGVLLDPRGPGPYLLGIGVIAAVWLVVRAIRGMQRKQ